MIDFEFYTEAEIARGMVEFTWRWRQKWTRQGAIQSARGFQQFNECVDDARRHGFRDAELPRGKCAMDLIRSALGD